MTLRDIEGGGFSSAEADAPAPIGHNKPPAGLATGDALLSRVKADHAKLFDRANDLLEAEERIPKAEDSTTLVCTNDQWEKNLTELSRQLAGAHNALDAARTNEIEPYRSAVSLVHGHFREVMDRLVDPDPKTKTSLRARIERALTRYKADKLEKERIAREREAEARRVAEAEERRKREETERAAAAEEQRRRDAAAAEAKRAEDAARAAAESAARKRNEKARAEAEAEAKRLAEEARRAQEKRRQEEEAAADERRKREETARAAEARAADERAAAEAAAAVPAASLTTTRSSNAQSGLREFVDYRDVNRETIDLDRLRSHIPADALEQAIRSYIGANSDSIKDEIKNRRQPIRGVIFFINQRTQVR
jgi:hypothetical protein